MSERIAEWAEWGNHIPLKCSSCGALFTTKNIGKIGDRKIFFGFNDKGEDAANKCECDFNLLKPDQEAWNNKD